MKQKAWMLFEKMTLGMKDEHGVWQRYLDRYIFFRTPWFQFMLHRFWRPDGDPDLHDHPWPFRTFILRGGYIERHEYGFTTLEQFDTAFVPVTKFHQVWKLLRVPTWTLIVTGRKVKSWSFKSEEDGLLIPWREYLSARGREVLPQ